MAIPIEMWIGIALLAAVLLALSVLLWRFGPRRGAFMQPAAALRPVGTPVAVMLYVLAAVQLLIAVLVAIRLGEDGPVWGLIVVAAVMALIYVAFAHAWALGTRTARHADRADAT